MAVKTKPQIQIKKKSKAIIKTKAKSNTKLAKEKSEVEEYNIQPLFLIAEKGKRKIKLDYLKLRRAALTLRALNHPLRKLMLKMMEENKKLTVSDIYLELNMEQSVASQHLGILRKADIVICTRSGKFVYYSVNKKRIEEITLLINDLAQQ